MASHFGKEPKQVQDWMKIKILGQGGFGTVNLWKNLATEEQVAIKQCRLQADKPKLRERWETEVDIMKRLDHPNVIAAKTVPEPLDVTKDVLPLLAMEYCSGGDLRKVLNLPENCCGLRESQIRNLAHDIASAIEYLHSKRIIHRDIKPENIVLQNAGEDKAIYKLIDLGYAKELDQSSICTSFVGTVQYLAPELFDKKKYSHTVDYWSFGTVIFECITGKRPFLPTSTIVQWHTEVYKKTNNQICAYQDSYGKVQFSERLPYPNHLCRTLQSYFEQWLRHMLHWDAKQRGGPDNSPGCFNLLKSILNFKIVRVLDVSRNRTMSYPILEDQHTVRKFQTIMSEELKVPMEEQELLLPSGNPPDPNMSAAHCCAEHGKEDEFVVFFFRSKNSDYLNESMRTKPLPASIQNIIKEPSTLLPYSEQKKAWAESVFFCQEQASELNKLVLAQRAAMINLLRLNSFFLKNKNKMLQDVDTLLARRDFFEVSLEHDQKNYKAQAEAGGITSESMFKKWQDMGENLKYVTELRHKVVALDERCRQLQDQIVALQRVPSKPKYRDTLNNLTISAQNLYLELQQASKEKRGDHSRIVEVISKTIVNHNNALKEVYSSLEKVSVYKQELKTILPEIGHCQSEIENQLEKLTAWQLRRQTDVWTLVKNALSCGNGSPTTGVLRESTKSDTNNLAFTAFSPDNSRGTSLRIIQDNKDTRSQLLNSLNFVCDEEENAQNLALDWDSLIK